MKTEEGFTDEQVAEELGLQHAYETYESDDFGDLVFDHGYRWDEERERWFEGYTDEQLAINHGWEKEHKDSLAELAVNEGYKWDEEKQVWIKKIF